MRCRRWEYRTIVSAPRECRHLIVYFGRQKVLALSTFYSHTVVVSPSQFRLEFRQKTPKPESVKITCVSSVSINTVWLLAVHLCGIQLGSWNFQYGEEKNVMVRSWQTICAKILLCLRSLGSEQMNFSPSLECLERT